MRDHQIDYGFTESALDWLSLETLSPHLRSFIDNNLSMLHKDAKISFLGAQGYDAAGRERERSDAAALMRALLEADDAEQEATDDTQQDGEEDETWRLAEAFSSWLVEICGSTLHPNFELGSLAFLRSPSHQALLHHFEDAPYTPIDDVPVHSLSASMFLPKQSVWNFRRKLHTEPPAPTPAPDRDMTVFDWGSITHRVMEAYHAHWDLLAADFASHSKDPKTNLGHTAIDERNFLMTASNGRYLQPEECISCVMAIAGREE